MHHIPKATFDLLEKGGFLPFLIQVSAPGGLLFQDATYPETRHVELYSARLVNPRPKKDHEGKEITIYDRESYKVATLDFSTKAESMSFLEEAHMRMARVEALKKV